MKYRLFFLLFFIFFYGTGISANHEIYIMKVSGSINPGIADYLKQGIRKASESQALCIIIELDTPGGLAEAMREIVMAVFASRVPVVVYVTPSGARAASAGVMITLAADIAAMSPGTNIGAAHPVGASGIRMLYEVYNQLLHRVGDEKQLDNPKLGLAHGVGGTPIDSSTGAVVILGTPD